MCEFTPLLIDAAHSAQITTRRTRTTVGDLIETDLVRIIALHCHELQLRLQSDPVVVQEAREMVLSDMVGKGLEPPPPLDATAQAFLEGRRPVSSSASLASRATLRSREGAGSSRASSRSRSLASRGGGREGRPVSVLSASNQGGGGAQRDSMSRLTSPKGTTERGREREGGREGGRE